MDWSDSHSYGSVALHVVWADRGLSIHRRQQQKRRAAEAPDREVDVGGAVLACEKMRETDTMQIKCSRMTDFMANLEDRPVRHETIYVDRTRTQESDVEYMVTIHASAVVLVDFAGDDATKLHDAGDVIGEEVFVLAGEECGMDIEAGNGGNEGTKKGDKLIEELEKYAESRGLQVKPGILDY